MDYDKLIEEKYAQIATLRSELVEIKRRRLEHESGFKEGDLVQNGKGVRGTLCFGYDPDYWCWHKLKKDGTPAANVCQVYDIYSCVKIKEDN
jgi:hypothetical protein